MAPCLTLMWEDAPQCEYELREVFNGLRYVIRGGIPWRLMPNDLPPWELVYQQTQRWLKAGVFEAMVHDLPELMRVAQGRLEQPSAVILDSRTMQSSPESGARAVQWPARASGDESRLQLLVGYSFNSPLISSTR